MKLLQQEIDANPASSPTMQPNLDGRVQKNAGVAVLDLVNSADAENNFWIWVRAAHAKDAWLEKFVSIEALGNVTGVQDNLENGKYKAYAVQRGSRRLMVRADPPQQPESRAGIYDMVATVQSQVPLKVGNDEQSLFEFPFRVVIRPYVAWNLAIEPEDVPVRLLKRKAWLWATVENSGNDWIYVDLRLPKESGNLSYERDTERIAVPPAVSAKVPSTRRIPIRVRSKYKNLRGTAIKMSVPLQGVRVDAPSVARFPSTADVVVPSLNLSSPVTLEPTTETKSASGANVSYYPPIPATFTDFVTSVRTNLMGLIGLFLMGCAAFYAGGFMYENLVHKLDRDKIKADKTQISPGGSVTLTGPNLGGCDVDVKAGDRHLPRTFERVSDSELKVTVNPPSDLPPGTPASIVVSRRGFGILSWPPIFPSLPIDVTIGKPAAKMEALQLQISPKVDLGKDLSIDNGGGPGFGKSAGTVKLGTQTLKIVSWSDDHIEAKVPSDPSFAAPGYALFVARADGSGTGKSTIEVSNPDAVAPGATAGATDSGAPPADPGAPPSDAGAGSPGGAPANGGGGAPANGPGNGGGSTPDSGTGGGGATTAFQPTPVYSAMLKAVQDDDSSALLDAAEQAASASDPNGKTLALYAYAQRGKKSRYDALYDALKGAPPADEDKAGWALYTMAMAEYDHAESAHLASAGDAAGSAKKAKEARMQYGVLAGYLKSVPDLELPKLALAKLKSGG